MKSNEIQFDLLFDSNEYHRSGSCPWTFFAYPTRLAVERGLPPDDDACKLLAELQHRGIEVSIWENGIVEDTTYFACRKEDAARLADILMELEALGVFDKDFFLNRSEALYRRLSENAESDTGGHR